jgi:hypothetical protein
MALQSFLGPWHLLQFRNLFVTQTVGLLGRVVQILTNNNVTCMGVRAWLLDGCWIGWLNLLTPYTLHLELQAIHRYFHTLKFTVTQECPQSLHSSLVVSWQRIHNSLTLNFKSNMKSSFHSLIPFLPLFCQLPAPELNSLLQLPALLTYLRGAQLSTRFWFRSKS